MKLFSALCGLVVIALLLAPAVGAEPDKIKIGGDSATVDVPVVAEVKEGKEFGAVETVEGRRFPGWFERRRLGLTPRNIRQTAADLKAKGELSNIPAIAATQVADEIIGKQPVEFKKVEAELDWNKIMEFIERIIEMFMRWFVYDVPHGENPFTDTVQAQPADKTPLTPESVGVIFQNSP